MAFWRFRGSWQNQTEPTLATVNQKSILIWYRNDLRIHDHEPLYKAVQEKAEIIPLYCFDDREFGTTSFGFPKTGAFRAQFLLESVADLRNSLRSLNPADLGKSLGSNLGSNLVVRRGLPE
ncbi:MAG: hypothetical protein F6K56_15080, partial [Moorea sp. SIO3G5]|nr:hypothetical protein [Moorena sp. SIO3G5]